MRDVGARAGVSGKTVSRVVNGDRYVSDAVRARVQQAISELDFDFDGYAREHFDRMSLAAADPAFDGYLAAAAR